MGTNNRQRRAAKKRQRSKVRPDRTGEARRVTANDVAAILWEGGPPLDPVLGELPARLVDTAVDMVLHRALGYLWHGGWLPYDVYQIVRRLLDDRHASLLVDAVAAEMRGYPAATVHPRWAGQLDEIGASVWWETDAPLLSQWATRHIETRWDALEVAVTLLGQLNRLGRLPQILPPPGTARFGPMRAGVDQKVLNRVRGLLAKAESTQYPDEAEALSAKAQELMNRHALEHAMLHADAPQLAVSRRMWLDKSYFRAKSQLVHVVAQANRSRAIAYEKLGFVALVGDEMDLEITEVLSTSLLVQATRAMVAAGAHAGRGSEARSRTYRQSFLVSYATRIGERLAEVNEPVADERLLPVLADRRQAVDELFDELFTHTKVTRVSVGSNAGWQAGRTAADIADIGVHRSSLTPG